MIIQQMFPKMCCISLIFLVFLGITQISYSAETQTDPFNDIQNEIIALRNEFRQRMQQADQDQLTIQEHLKARIEALMASQQAAHTNAPELKKKIKNLKAIIESYSASIANLEQILNTIELTMNTNLDTVATGLKTVKGQKLQGNIGRAPIPTPTPADALGDLEIPAGQLFRAAYRFYMENDYDTAIAGFQKYLADYPNTELAGAAQYWIAESFAKLKEYETALAEYDLFFQKYPQNDKAADAYYGKGVALLLSGRTDEAKAAFLYVQDHFPGTTAAKKAQNRLTEFP